MNLFKLSFALLIGFMSIINIKAAEGDTTEVIIIEDGLWDWYGNIYGTGVFPTDKNYRKVTFRYVLGCPTGGCSDWDYSTSIYLRHNTGDLDSTLTDYPTFLADGSQLDTLFISSSPTYNVSYDDSLINDSSESTVQVINFSDAYNPDQPVDTVDYYLGNFYTYTYDSAGIAIDSSWNAATDTMVLSFNQAYVVWEVIEEYEVARVITPYGGYWSSPREQVYEFDLTDYQHLLKDSVEFRALYQGWQAGWNLNLEMEMIEGTQPRVCTDIVELWEGEYKYGVVSDPIASRITPLDVYISEETEGLRLRGLITGHSFGGNENCAEFCPKTHNFQVDDQYTYQQFAWRQDCGYNPVYPQNGTWVYNRAGWCPGLDVEWYEYELTDIMTSGDTMNIAYNFDSYTYDGTASYDPNYRIATYLYMYDAPSFSLDAEVTDIISPSSKTAHSRLNPICGNPEIMIRNSGSTVLTSLDINYGVKGGNMQTYSWTGNLEFMEETKVTLDALVDISSLQESGSKFVVTISAPNGGTDEYNENDMMESDFEKAPVHDGNMVVWFRTNNASWETTYKITDVEGNIVQQNQSPLSASTLYKDTIDLAQGCYVLEVIDSGGDGLSWWANNDGSGYIQFRAANGTPAIVESFSGDHGSGFKYAFTVGEYTSVQENTIDFFADIYPNPSNTGVFNVELLFNQTSNVQLEVYNINGELVKGETLSNIKEASTNLDLSNFDSGIYVVRIISGNNVVNKRIVISK